MGSKQAEFHEAASLEFEAAFVWYLERSERAALRFVRELERAVASIVDSPERFPAAISGTRRCLLREFPFVVVYRELPSGILVIAVAHGAGARTIGKPDFKSYVAFIALLTRAAILFALGQLTQKSPLCTHVQLFLFIHSVKSAMMSGSLRARLPCLRVPILGYKFDTARGHQANKLAVAISAATSRALNPFAATHPQTARVTPFPATHTNSFAPKPFRCHTSGKQGGWGGRSIPPSTTETNLARQYLLLRRIA
jgi:plasmid stabilization system protein ParE